MVRSGWLLNAVLLCSVVTATVTHALDREGWLIPASNDPTMSVQPLPVPPWSPQVVVNTLGKSVSMTHDAQFATEDECKAFMATEDFKVQLVEMLMEFAVEDVGAVAMGEPVCVEQAAPSRAL